MKSENHLINRDLMRPADITKSINNPGEALNNLKLKALYSLDIIIKEMIDYKLQIAG